MLPYLLLAFAADSLIERTSAIVSENAAHVERLSCTQTITRETRRGRPLSRDRLHLDVILSGGDEVHSWPGGGAIKREMLALMTARAFFGTGDFAAFPISIFAERAATLTALKSDGKMAVYRYEVPLERSHYRLERYTVPYSGEVAIDAASARLMRLTVETTDVPAATGLTGTRSIIEFSSSEGPLVPRRTVVEARLPDGTETVNTTDYNGCRVFHAESAVNFDFGTDRMAGNEENFALPTGKTVRLRLAETLDSNTTAAGDPLRFTVAAAIRNGREVVLPAGAAVYARIVHLEQEFEPRRGFWLLLVFDEVELGGRRHVIRLQPGPQPLREIGRLPAYPLTTEGPKAVGRFWFENMDPLLLRPGWESIWLTY